MTNEERRNLLDRYKTSDFPGSITEVFSAARRGVDLIGQFEQQNNIQVANTPKQYEQGLRPAHQAGDINRSMVFPDVPPNTSFNTMGMKAPINIQKFDNQGHLVKSYENVPPGIQSLPTGPQRGTVIETPARMQRGGFAASESTYQPSFAEQAFLNQQNALPKLNTPLYKDEGTIREGNFEVDKDNNIVEDRPSVLEMAANPMATARAIIDPSVEGLPSQVEFDQSKSKGNIVGQAANDMVNPAAWVNYGVNAYQDFGDATKYAIQGEGQKALSSLGSGALNLLEAIPGAPLGGAATKTTAKYAAAPYLLNKNRANPFNFRNVGDTPHWWRGYENPIKAETVDMTQGFGDYYTKYKQLGRQRDFQIGTKLGEYLEEGQKKFGKDFDGRRIPGSAPTPEMEAWTKAAYERAHLEVPDYAAKLNASIPFMGKKVGQGSYGSVYEFADNPNYVFKVGKAMEDATMTPEFIQAASKFKDSPNIAVPLNRGLFKQDDYVLQGWDGPTFYRGSMAEAYKMRNLNAPGNATQQFAGLNPRDAQALKLKTARQLRDSGIRLDFARDAGNLEGSKVSPGLTNFFDLSYAPQIAPGGSYSARYNREMYNKLIPRERQLLNGGINKLQGGGMLTRNALENYLAENRGGTPEMWRAAADTIAYHESGPKQRMSPTALQDKGGPGRGMFQFETTHSESFATAQNRHKNIARVTGKTPDPEIMRATSAEQLPADKQYALFYSHLIEEPKVRLADYPTGKLPLVDMWLQGHKKVEKSGNRRSFAASTAEAKRSGIPR
jgi:uncharacterized membrane protein (UPF0127 family)